MNVSVHVSPTVLPLLVLWEELKRLWSAHLRRGRRRSASTLSHFSLHKEVIGEGSLELCPSRWERLWRDFLPLWEGCGWEGRSRERKRRRYGRYILGVVREDGDLVGGLTVMLLNVGADQKVARLKLIWTKASKV